ncbi:GNAT family N-acetyltransferase [Nocardioides campestrisoli]|uniref:GNAT family N-acetyltransferase n=1 Tax=Nocardioides campestrisoli TaxID=2736757 RepID=UPI0015E6AD91|nr:GNAT family N-acetyltransferase [Nocardioides campestrisoli]
MITTRQGRPEDSDRLREIDQRTWSPQVAPMPREDPSAPFFGDRLAPADALVAVTEDDVPVGYALLQQHTQAPSHAHVVLLNGLAVDPERQGQGIGRLLLEATRAEARRRGATKLSLRVLSTNEDAMRLYRSHGFVVEGTLRGEFVLDDREVDDVLMACRLDGPDES